MENVFDRVFRTFGAVLRLILRCFSWFRQLMMKFERAMSRKQLNDCFLFTCFLLFWTGLEWFHKPKDTGYSGVVNEDFYVPILLFLASDRERTFLLGNYVPFRILFQLFSMCSSYTPTDSNFKLRVVTSVLAFLTFCYRMVIIKRLLVTKTVKSTSFLLCVFMFSSAVFWFIASVLQRDLFAAIPNGFVSCLGAWQLILYAKYRTRDQRGM